MIVQDKAIVLHRLLYGESDWIATLLTNSYGVRTYFLRGILSQKKGKLRPSLFQPLSIIDIVAYHRNKGSLERIRDAQLRTPFTHLHHNPHKSSVVLFLSEILKNTVVEQLAHPELFLFIETALVWWDHQDSCPNFHILFLIKLSQFLGFYPNTANINKAIFNLKEAQFENTPTDRYSLDPAQSSVWKRVLDINFETCQDIKLSQATRKELLEIVLQYYALHLHHFRKPKSFEILTALYS